MTTQQCSAILRLFIFMALTVGFFGFLAGPHVASTAGAAMVPTGNLSLTVSH